MKFCAIPEFHKQARTEPPLRDSLDELQQREVGVDLAVSAVTMRGQAPSKD
jgi:hypothetical protein